MSNKTHARKTDCVSFALIAASKHPLKEEILVNPLAFRRGKQLQRTKNPRLEFSLETMKGTTGQNEETKQNKQKKITNVNTQRVGKGSD